MVNEQHKPKLGTLSRAEINHIAESLSIEHQIPEQENRIRWIVAAMDRTIKKTGCTKNDPRLNRYWKELEKMGITPDYFLKGLGKALKGVGKGIGKAAKKVGKVAGKVGSTLGKVALAQAGLDPTMFDKKKPETTDSAPVYDAQAAPVTTNATNQPTQTQGGTISGGGGGSTDDGESTQETPQNEQPARPGTVTTPAGNNKMIFIIGGALLALVVIIVLMKKK